MKNVVNKETVAHLWANKVQNSARTPNGSMYFDGDSVFSYGSHFCIAKHIRNDNNVNGILFTIRKYSVTTSVQCGIVRQALNGQNIIYCTYPNGTKLDNLKEWLKQSENALIEAGKAKQERTKIKFLAVIPQINTEVNAYCTFFGIELKEYFPALFCILKVSEIKQVAEYIAERLELERIANEKRIAEQKKRQAKVLKEFRIGKRITLYMHNGFDYLRFNGETKRVETSQRVEIPERIAKNFYKQIINTLKTGECKVCGNKFMDAYEIKEINKKFIRVGCHKITIKEIQKLVKEQNW